MRIVRKILAAALCAAIILSLLCSGAFALRVTSMEQKLAEDLKAIGLFKGVSEDDFDLNRAPTREEALVMLIRLLGKEDEALKGTWTHPFTDVPEWADKYVGYAYEKGLTKGVSATEFAAGDAADSNMYLTFVLRALGYSDDFGDFKWDESRNLAAVCGLSTQFVDHDDFLRADVVIVSYTALGVFMKGSTDRLKDRLIAQGAVDAQEYAEHINELALFPKGGLSADTEAEAAQNIEERYMYHVEETLTSSGGYGTVVNGSLSTPHGGSPILYLAFGKNSAMGEGRVNGSPLPRVYYWNNGAPDEIKLTGEGDNTLEYNAYYAEKYEGPDASGEAIVTWRPAGYFCYSLNLDTGDCLLTVYDSKDTKTANVIMRSITNVVTGAYTELTPR